MIDDEDTSELWTARLANKLYVMGFGDTARTMPLGEVLREFQISASSATAAVARNATVTDEKLAERNFADLKAQANLHRYDGPISGRANAATRRALDGWTTSGQRCPVLIPAYPGAALDSATLRPRAGEVPTFRDLWKRQETLDISLRMFAADFSQVEAGSSLGLGELEPIGHCSRWAKTQTEVFFGPGTLPPTAVSRVENAEVTPRRLLEVSEGDLLTPMPPDDPDLLAKRSTFKVIRAVSEFECLGYLDQVNAYDNAGISFGPCHWSMAGAIDAPKGNTEFGGFAAYLTFLAERQGRPDFDVSRAHGVTADGKKGTDRAATARRSSDAAFRNQLQFIDDRGEPVPMNAAGPRDILPSWRSYQRWIAIGRRDPLIGQAAWGLAVRRLQALRVVPISLNEPPEDARPNIGAMPTIGKVFTSELAMARIMRWHTKIASGVAKGVGKDLTASKYIAAAYGDARPADRADPAAWEEELLRMLSIQLDRFVASTGTSHAELPGNFEDLADPDWTHTETITPGANPRAYGLDPRLRRLSREAGSFKLASLPAAMVP